MLQAKSSSLLRLVTSDVDVSYQIGLGVVGGETISTAQNCRLKLLTDAAAKGIEVQPVAGLAKTAELPLQLLPDQVVTVPPLSALRTSKELPGLWLEHMVLEPDLIDKADDPLQPDPDHVSAA
ncbi:hypothetical protein IFM58399_03142 [Aspergillus lentulus]|uniref:Uncharacterized protein n=1 Tax=Aspergillus lentulus TaxID=293939 RepID=A0AAN5YQP5_ASPLE|nr:uncharacterized protein IFM58399_03142 [Aspergillus lentulus]KAF4153180.1 hypothetical protein CNMCM6069_001142 [Aspergillus lentulus]KAF4163032.1 hypothetical protein CNMCM6936_001341 [Aspergillus lentulus]KAF4172364.1 hypothetical protein CNMCM8060_001661 [Aspergillus lentulus]KAF4184459.1 hypothetical protein CNMCM7927_007825 [Aspergillus lentulus]KAF4192079.1 hypothetical protein CNMCM8694_000926 [Aspergillus lentulus]